MSRKYVLFESISNVNVHVGKILISIYLKFLKSFTEEFLLIPALEKKSYIFQIYFIFAYIFNICLFIIHSIIWKREREIIIPYIENKNRRKMENSFLSAHEKLRIICCGTKLTEIYISF